MNSDRRRCRSLFFWPRHCQDEEEEEKYKLFDDNVITTRFMLAVFFFSYLNIVSGMTTRCAGYDGFLSIFSFKVKKGRRRIVATPSGIKNDF